MGPLEDWKQKEVRDRKKIPGHLTIGMADNPCPYCSGRVFRVWSLYEGILSAYCVDNGYFSEDPDWTKQNMTIIDTATGQVSSQEMSAALSKPGNTNGLVRRKKIHVEVKEKPRQRLVLRKRKKRNQGTLF